MATHACISPALRAAHLAAGLARKTHAMPMSHLVPMRPSGMLPTIFCCIAPAPGPSLVMPAVPSIGPGATPLTRTPNAPHSSASVRVRLSTAALAADACTCRVDLPRRRRVGGEGRGRWRADELGRGRLGVGQAQGRANKGERVGGWGGRVHGWLGLGTQAGWVGNGRECVCQRQGRLTFVTTILRNIPGGGGDVLEVAGAEFDAA
eukprot:365333-Chlamydomonas_euryale.AAC.20